jgi:hypothetical protein
MDMPGLPAEAGEQIITDNVKCGKMNAGSGKVGKWISNRNGWQAPKPSKNYWSGWKNSYSQVASRRNRLPKKQMDKKLYADPESVKRLLERAAAVIQKLERKLDGKKPPAKT